MSTSAPVLSRAARFPAPSFVVVKGEGKVRGTFTVTVLDKSLKRDKYGSTPSWVDALRVQSDDAVVNGIALTLDVHVQATPGTLYPELRPADGDWRPHVYGQGKHKRADQFGYDSATEGQKTQLRALWLRLVDEVTPDQWEAARRCQLARAVDEAEGKVEAARRALAEAEAERVARDRTLAEAAGLAS